jgi:hypothetical protein
MWWIILLAVIIMCPELLVVIAMGGLAFLAYIISLIRPLWK